jgi:NAD(P)-dependent dehydrogenase (short-subunit alcohol dehydrogenase family)
MLRRGVDENPGCDGMVLGSHGLFTWGDTQAECYRNSIRTIDQMGQFVREHAGRSGRTPFGGASVTAPPQGDAVIASVLPHLRGAVSSNRRVIAHVERSAEALTFANSTWAAELCALGTSCPDHFLRTRISPLFVPWNPAVDDVAALRRRIDERLARYRSDYNAYYASFATPESPALRDSNPSVVVIPALGIFGFAKDKREARITTEFFVNAIHVMAGATALEDAGAPAGALPQARRPEQAAQFTSFHNYVALPRAEAFRIEYWALEDAKLRRMPPEREFSRKIAIVVGGASGIGREVALQLARRGAHVVVADQNADAAETTWSEARTLSSSEMGMSTSLDLSSRDSIARAVRDAVLQFGGVDIVINTAAIYPTPEPGGAASEAAWGNTLLVNVTSNHLLADEAFTVLQAQNLPSAIVLTSSANAVVPKHGSEPYDVSKAAVNHLIRELAVGLGPLVRVNGIAPATVVAGSSMFPRDRVMSSLGKYNIPFDASESTEALRARLADFYAQRTITRRPILPIDCANAICWLAGDQSARTTGHVIPVDGGLPEAFLR